MPEPPCVSSPCSCTSCDPIILSATEQHQLAAVAALVREIAPERSAVLSQRDHLAFALELAGEQATDFRHRLARMRLRRAESFVVA